MLCVGGVVGGGWGVGGCGGWGWGVVTFLCLLAARFSLFVESKNNKKPLSISSANTTLRHNIRIEGEIADT